MENGHTRYEIGSPEGWLEGLSTTVVTNEATGWRGLMGRSINTQRVRNDSFTQPISEMHRGIGELIHNIESTFKLVQLMERYENLLLDDNIDADQRDFFKQALEFYTREAIGSLAGRDLSHLSRYEVGDAWNPSSAPTSERLKFERARFDITELGMFHGSADFFSVMDSALARSHTLNNQISPDGRVAMPQYIDAQLGRLSGIELKQFDWENNMFRHLGQGQHNELWNTRLLAMHSIFQFQYFMPPHTF